MTSQDSNANRTSSKVELGKTYIELQTFAAQYAANNHYTVGGYWEPRKKQFAAIPGAKLRGHGWGYELPANTDPALIDSLSGAIYAEPLSGLTFERMDAAHNIEYTTLYKGQAIRLIVWPESVLFEAKEITFSNVRYNASYEFHHENDVYVGKDRYTRRSENWADITDAARMKMGELFGAILASFLRDVSNAFNQADVLVHQREIDRVNREIAELEKQLAAKRQELAALD